MTEILPSFPFRVEIEVINRCNLSCDYCYAAPFDGLVMPQEQLKYIISKTEIQVVPFDVVFLGGEPFLRPDMVDILEYAKFTLSTNQVSISTNGTVFKGMDRKKLRRLKSMSQESPFIQVSIDSTTNPQIDKSIKTFEGIRILQENEIPFRAGIVLTQRNYADFPRTLSDLLELSYLRSINPETLQKINDLHYNQNRLTSLQVSNITATIRALIKEKKREDVYIDGISEEDPKLQSKIFLRNENNAELKDRRIVNAGVYANGNVSMDGVLDRGRIVGNILRQDWREIWENAKKLYISERKNPMLKVLQT
jgi:MoaA/NifB/PqqE/SkfB family radical SAM enzyme